jgi:NAD(P)-dependent dehydrogenase (short-subunit alcohol dehydrogenase family)
LTPSRILITGASSGIGQAVAKRLAETGQALILHGRNEARLEQTRALLAGKNHVIWPFDLTRPEEIEAGLGALLEHQGRAVHGFVHSAGVAMVRPLRLFTPADAAALMAVNYSAALEVTRILALKKWCRDSLRAVVYISSIASRQAPQGFGPYAASKAALEALTRSLALELAPAIRVNCIRPGPLATPGNAAIREAGGGGLAVPPLGKGETEDIAAAVAFLFSKDARWITGQTLTVDGGQSLI